MKYHKGFSILEVILLIAVIGLVGAVGWLAWSNFSRPEADSVEKKQAAAQSTQKKVEPKLPILADVADYVGDLKTLQDDQNVVSFQYPAAWTIDWNYEAQLGKTDTNAHNKIVNIIPSNAPSVNNNTPKMKNSINISVEKDTDQTLDSYNDAWGVDENFKPYVPQRMTVDGKPAYYWKFIKKEYVDHELYIQDGKTIVSVGFRQSQAGTLSPDEIPFDASSALPGFKAIVNTLKFL